MILPFCVYVLFSESDNLLYIGYTTDIASRLRNHNNGGTKSTAPRRPLKLIFCELYLLKQDAQRREKYLKTTAGKKAMKLMLRDTLAELNYAGQQLS